ncbi:MAG: flagellar biosynthetic protein FliO [Planctomycetes bacterium]|nr:flagellar biosynthetic protein FliO [Planctomycetota bacterium]MBL7042778.1 flagellar biosynthetic protein FliO [Pirellulaceae bacterium]
MPPLGRCHLITILLAGSATCASAQGEPEGASPARLPIQFVRSAEPAQETHATSPADGPLPLEPPSDRRSNEGRSRLPKSPAGAATTVITSLAVVLGLFALIIWFARRVGPKGNAALPGDVVETLGRAHLSGRQEMHLVRVGNKLLLLSVTPTGAETLTEITDPAEIDRLAGICRQNQPGSITASFREALSQLNHHPSTSDR